MLQLCSNAQNRQATRQPEPFTGQPSPDPRTGIKTIRLPFMPPDFYFILSRFPCRFSPVILQENPVGKGKTRKGTLFAGPLAKIMLS